MCARPCAHQKQCVGRPGRKGFGGGGGKRATIVPRREILCEKLEPDKGFFYARGQQSDQSQLCLKSVEGRGWEEGGLGGAVNFKASVTDLLPASAPSPSSSPVPLHEDSYSHFHPLSWEKKKCMHENFKQREPNDLFSSFYKCRFNRRSFHLLNGSGGA